MLSNDPLVMNITYSLLEFDPIFQDLPLINKPTLKINGTRWVGSLPSVGWRQINESTSVTSGNPSPWSEQAFIVSNAIDVDIKLLQDQNQISDPRVVQTNAWLKSLAYDFNDKFFNNDPVTGDPDAPVGLKYRLDNYSTYGNSSTCKIDGAGVDMTTSMTATTANTFIETVDSLLDAMGSPDGDGVVLYMNRNLRRRFARAIRVLGAAAGFEMTKDAFDRRVEMYRNAIVRTVGIKSDQSTEIITSTEANTGVAGSSTYTSLYGVRYGDGYCKGWQMAPLYVQDIGQRSDEPTMTRLFIDWAFGYATEDIRSAARVYDIKVA